MKRLGAWGRPLRQAQGKGRGENGPGLLLKFFGFILSDLGGLFRTVVISRWNYGGDFKHKSGAAAGLAADVDSTAVLLNDFLAYRQTQARACALLRGNK